MGKTQLTGKNIKDTSIDLTLDVTGILPVPNGGTGASTQTGALTNLGILRAFKPSDTSLEGTDTLTADPHLSVTLAAGKTYAITVDMFQPADSKSISFDLNGGTATMTYIWGAAWVIISDEASIGTTAPVNSLTASVGTNADLNSHIRYEITVVVNAGGTFIPRWTDGANGDAVVIKRGSRMIATLLD